MVSSSTKVFKSFSAWMFSVLVINSVVKLVCLMYNLNPSPEAQYLIMGVSFLPGVAFFFMIPYLDGYFSKPQEAKRIRTYYD